MEAGPDGVGKKLVALAQLIRALKIISLRAVHQQQIRRIALGIEIAAGAVLGEPHFEERVVPPQLIFDRRENPVAGNIQCHRLRMQRIESHVGVALVVVEKSEMQAVVRRNVP